jgi:hypothetical protein
MNRTLLCLLTWFAVSVGQPARGAVFERDWQTPGDGLLTYDDVNRREWLDVTQTQLWLFPGNRSRRRIDRALV